MSWRPLGARTRSLASGGSVPSPSPILCLWPPGALEFGGVWACVCGDVYMCVGSRSLSSIWPIPAWTSWGGGQGQEETPAALRDPFLLHTEDGDALSLQGAP